MKIKIEVEIDTVEDRDELEELIVQLQSLRQLLINIEEDQNDRNS
jgi:hypothetical protein